MYSVSRHCLSFVPSSVVTFSTFENIVADGAVININIIDIYFECICCFFKRNEGNDRGGAICIKDCSKAAFKQLCFNDNYAPFSPAFIIWSDCNDIRMSEVNYTSEVTYQKCNHGSCPGGKSQSINYYNNVSHVTLFDDSKYNIWRSLILENNLYIEYSEFFNCSGYSLFGFSGETKTYLNKLNIISCYSVAYFVCFYINDNNIKEMNHIYNDVVYMNTTISSLHDSKQFDPYFQYCYADILSNVPSINISEDLEKHDYFLDFCQMPYKNIKTAIHYKNILNNNLLFLFTFISLCSY